MTNIANMQAILDNYLFEKTTPLKDNLFAKKITKEFPEELTKTLGEPGFSVKGSVGIGQWAEVPWICIYDKSITEKTTEGIYIAILFRADMSGFYLILNQGWTYFAESYKPVKIARKKIAKASYAISKLVDDRGFNFENINLASNKPLAKGYELGTVYSKFYKSGENYEETEFLSDIKLFIDILKDVSREIGSKRNYIDFYKEILSKDDGVFQEDGESENDYQEAVEAQTVNQSPNIEEASMRREVSINKKGKEYWPRNAQIAANALKNASYLCEIDPSHITFISNVSNKSYMEAHHLIPMSKQGDFPYSLDKEANIKSLCPNCHRAIHHGQKEIKESYIAKLYNDSKEQLKRLHIEVTLEDLKKMY